MANVEIKLNTKAVGELLKSDEVVKLMQNEAERIAGTLEGEYDISTHIGETRANVSISTSDAETYWKNLQNNMMIKALHK